MPFTPFHMGPGLLIKSLLQGAFSLMVFGWAQIVMDLQPLFALITGEGRLHGFSHTFAGALLLAVVSAVSGKYLAQVFLLLCSLLEEGVTVKISWPVAGTSALIGTFSHVILDGIMHRDMTPFQPFADINPLLGMITVDLLHDLLLYSGCIGMVIYLFLRLFLSAHRGR